MLTYPASGKVQNSLLSDYPLEYQKFIPTPTPPPPTPPPPHPPTPHPHHPTPPPPLHHQHPHPHPPVAETGIFQGDVAVDVLAPQPLICSGGTPNTVSNAEDGQKYTFKITTTHPRDKWVNPLCCICSPEDHCCSSLIRQMAW